MLSPIQEKFDGLEKKHQDLLQRLNSLSSDVLSFKAGPDKWSIVEVVEHLVIAEKGLIEQLASEGHSPLFDSKSRSAQKFQTVITVMEKDIEVDVPHESLVQDRPDRRTRHHALRFRPLHRLRYLRNGLQVRRPDP